MKELILVLSVAALGGVFGLGVAQSVVVEHSRQHKTVRWEIRGEPGAGWMSTWEKGTRVEVIDTTGVCLYLFSGTDGKGAIAAVPKTQLPAGAGCE